MDGKGSRMDTQRSGPSWITVKERGSGLPFALAGFLIGIAAVWKMFTAFSIFVTGIFACGQTSGQLSMVRAQLVIGILAGGLALALSEAGVRRQVSVRWLSLIGSVAGIFVIMVGLACLTVSVFPEFANCWAS